jgi:hypothetical protein
MNTTSHSLDTLIDTFGERLKGRFFGKYRGTVTLVDDPLKIGRIKAKVPLVLGEKQESGWALPCTPFGGGKDRGFMMLPEVGDNVWLEFEQGDPTLPVWVGCFWSAPDGKTEGPTGGIQGDKTGKKEAAKHYEILRTFKGHRLIFDDDGEIMVFANGNHKTEIRFTKEGEVIVHADKDVKIDAKANVDIVAAKDMYLKAKNMVLDADKISIGKKGTSEPLVLGNKMEALFNKHTHPTGTGPTGTPTQKMGQPEKSKDHKTE